MLSMNSLRRAAIVAVSTFLSVIPQAWAQVPQVPGPQGPELPEVAAKLINAFLSVLGIVAVVVVIIGGFKWLTSGGSEERVEEAKKMLMSGVIGVIIIMAAFAIARFVVGSVYIAVQ